MPLRLVEIIIPNKRLDDVLEAIEEFEALPDPRHWLSALEKENVSIKIIADIGESGPLLDSIADKLPLGENYRVLLYPVEATLPRLKEIEDKEDEAVKDNSRVEEGQENSSNRISREELYQDVMDMAALTRSNLILVALSAIVASVGVLNDNVAVIIGSMVIAPLIGPNMGLILAAALGDGALLRASTKTLGVGVLLAIILATLVGVLLDPNPQGNEIASRMSLGFSDVVLAMASGAAGIFSFTMGAPTIVVGVMVALALLPPLAVSGLMLGAGYFSHALSAFLLFVTNIVCLNLAGILSLLLQGIRPYKWYEREKAKAASKKALAIWAGLLLLLIGVILLKRSLGIL